MTVLRQFLGSMAGRIFMICMAGAIASAALALGMAAIKREIDQRRMRFEHIAERAQDFVDLVNHAPPGAIDELLLQGIPKLRPVSLEARSQALEPELTRLLRVRLSPDTMPMAERMASRDCVRRPRLSYRTPLDVQYEREITCWLVKLNVNGRQVRLSYLEQKGDGRGPAAGDPLFFAILALGVAVAALIAARMAAAPLHRLSRAATALGGNLDQAPLPEYGPFEVRDAAKAFNSMQALLKRHMKERHQMLASITHDLQTPLTRLRLRADKVADEQLRGRMLGDLAAMQQLIREGLELARGDEAGEPRVKFDVDSMLESLAADAIDSGHKVTLSSLCGCVLLGHAQSLKRALSNLIDNALKYGGVAYITSAYDGATLTIVVSDDGPGLPPDQLEAVLEPFVRLETSRSRTTGGVGLGLTIARQLAERNGGSLKLANRPGGGLDATITLPGCAVLRTRSDRRQRGPPTRTPADTM